MEARQHWNLGKIAKMLSCLFLSAGSCLVVTLFFSPDSETLLQVSPDRLFLYSILYGMLFLLAGEMMGVFESSRLVAAWKRGMTCFFSAASSTFGLLVVVWLVEFDFIGRFVILKMTLCSGSGVLVFLESLHFLANRNPWRVLALVDSRRRVMLAESSRDQMAAFEWIDSDPQFDPDEFSSFLELCRTKGIDILVVEGRESAIKESQVMELLASGVRVMLASDFIETFCRKIPHADLDHRWLARLNLRQRDPLLRRIKRMVDLSVSFLGLILSFPILVLACVAIVLESGFPVFFTQPRSGLLGRPYTLYKLRTMRRHAEEHGAEWAKEKDDRVTRVGRFLRRTRIDEIPQFWNVIKGEMSIVGPRPERPELEAAIEDRLPYWKCRYLLKPGVTGWAQIRFQYASDLESSEEKLAYDLFYVKNASFFLDLEIILATLRSLTKGSR